VSVIRVGARTAAGEMEYSVVATGVPCYHYTTTNIDKSLAVGKLKEDMVFTYDYLHFEASVDIRPEDVLLFTDTGHEHTGGYYAVMGAPKVRQNTARRRPNEAMAYINQTKAPITGISPT